MPDEKKSLVLRAIRKELLWRNVEKKQMLDLLTGILGNYDDGNYSRARISGGRWCLGR
jgi:hypothetical protein